jgi:hypothetical protein
MDGSPRFSFIDQAWGEPVGAPHAGAAPPPITPPPPLRHTADPPRRDLPPPPFVRLAESVTPHYARSLLALLFMGLILLVLIHLSVKLVQIHSVLRELLSKAS